MLRVLLRRLCMMRPLLSRPTVGCEWKSVCVVVIIGAGGGGRLWVVRRVRRVSADLMSNW